MADLGLTAALQELASDEGLTNYLNEALGVGSPGSEPMAAPHSGADPGSWTIQVPFELGSATAASSAPQTQPTATVAARPRAVPAVTPAVVAGRAAPTSASAAGDDNLDNLFGYDPTLPVLNGDPRLNPGNGLGVNWHPSQPVRNEWADWGNTTARTFNIETQSFQQSPAELMKDMLAVVQLSAMVGAQRSVTQAVERGGVSADARVVAAAAAAAASRMAPLMLRLVQQRRRAPAPAPINMNVSLPSLTTAGSKPHTIDAATVAKAEERRLKRLERNRNAALKSRLRYKHRVQCMEEELARLSARRAAFESHKWGVDAAIAPAAGAAGAAGGGAGGRGDAADSKVQPSHDVLSACMAPRRRPYVPDEDNYADFLVMRAEYRRQQAATVPERVARLKDTLRTIRHGASAMQNAVFGHMYLLWAAEATCKCPTQCDESEECGALCSAKTYREFKTRKAKTSAEVTKAIGPLSKSHARQLLQWRGGVKASMQWLRQLSSIMARFEGLLQRGISASSRLDGVLATVLTAQQLEKLGQWFTEHGDVLKAARVSQPTTGAMNGGAATRKASELHGATVVAQGTAKRRRQ